MNAADAAWEAAHAAREERRYKARLARETALAGNPAAAQAVRDAWEPIRLWQKELRGYGRYERAEPEGVVRND
jgi:hypothetical protein